MPDVPEEDRRWGGDGGIVSKFDVKVRARRGSDISRSRSRLLGAVR